MKANKFLRFPWYALLLALYSPLALLANNLGQLDWSLATRSLTISLGSSLFLLLLFWWQLKDLQKAGILVVFLEILFFSYGHIYTVIKNIEIAGFLIGRHRYLAILWLGLVLFGIWWILKKLRFTTITESVNLVFLFLLLIPLMEIILFEYKKSGYEQITPIEKESLVMPASEGLPDIYFIVLDGYGRSDVLLENFDYDNSSFIAELENLGFYVATCSQSNYSKTDLSLASMLNFNYLDALSSEFSPENTDRAPLWNLVKYSAVAENLREMGYQIRAFETGFDFTQIEPVDSFYITPGKGFNDFENFFLKTTAIAILDDAGFFSRFHLTADDYKFNRILFSLDTLEEIPKLPGPNYVFAHLLIPHQPFVFGADGEMVVVQKHSSNNSEYYSDENYIRGYKNQAVFISKRIAEVAENIINTSAIQPIIIIQGDHGPSHFSDADRMGILNAYYFPESQAEFYTTITPVNSFRLLFSTYFGENYPLLKDISYYSDYPNAYKYKEISNECHK